MVIWQSVPIKVRFKQPHVKKLGGRMFYSFCDDWGDLPRAVWNPQTQRLEAVVNPRGMAYAARKRSRYRRSKDAAR